MAGVGTGVLRTRQPKVMMLATWSKAMVLRLSSYTIVENGSIFEFDRNILMQEGNMPREARSVLSGGDGRQQWRSICMIAPSETPAWSSFMQVLHLVIQSLPT